MGLQSVIPVAVKRKLSETNCISADKNKKLMAFWSEELKDEDEEISDDDADIDAEFEDDEDDDDEDMDSDEEAGDTTLPAIQCLTKLNGMDSYSYDKPGYEADSNDNLPQCRYSGYNGNPLWSNDSYSYSSDSSLKRDYSVNKPTSPVCGYSSPWQNTSYAHTYEQSTPYNSKRRTLPTDPSGNKRFEEEGKSYLEIGSCNTYSNGIKPVPQRHSNCSLNRGNSWFNSQQYRPTPKVSCYSHQRLEVLNISMWKLKRFRSSGSYSELSLHKSVLICNTLRSIEREMEREGMKLQPVTSPSESRHLSMEMASGPGPAGSCPTPSYQMLTPLPMDNPPVYHPILTSTSYTDDKDDDEDSINWSSVLSLSTQSDMDVTSDSGISDLLPSSRTSAAALTTPAALCYGGPMDMDTESWKLTPLNTECMPLFTAHTCFEH